MTRQQFEYELEEDIRELAKLDQNHDFTGKRGKRTFKEGRIGQARLLSPFLFTHQTHDGAILRRVVLSPRALGQELMSPEFLSAHVLSPAAFTPIVLSPRVMLATIL